MTEEKISPQERINLLSEKIDEIKELSDHCVILTNVEAEGLEGDTFVVAKGKVTVQAQMIDCFFKHAPKVYKSLFFQWNCIILCCACLLLSILMWWCE